MARVQQNKEEKLIKELLTKLQKLYKSCYITNAGYVLDENYSDKHAGMFICILEQKYLEMVSHMFTDSCGVIYFKDIAVAKENPDEHVVKVKKLDDVQYGTMDKSTKYIDSSFYDTIDRYMGYVADVKKWNEFVLDDDPTKNEEMAKSLFKDNEYISLNTINPDTRTASVIIGKSLFPLVTEKTCQDDLRYSTCPFNDDVNILIFDFQFTHFKVYMFYYYVSLE